MSAIDEEEGNTLRLYRESGVLSALALFENEIKKEMSQSKNQDVHDSLSIAKRILDECFQIQNGKEEKGKEK